LFSHIGEFSSGAGLLSIGLHFPACSGALGSLPTQFLLFLLDFVVVCRLLKNRSLLYLLFLFFDLGSRCCICCCCLLLRPINESFWCFLLLLFVLSRLLLVPLYLLFLLLCCWCNLFLLFWYFGHCHIFVRFLLMHRTRGLSGRPGGQLFTEGLGALRKDSRRRHRCGLLRGLRLRGLVTGAPCATCVNTGTLLIFPRTCNPMSQGCVFTFL
jgi:hypothetical protein